MLPSLYTICTYTLRARALKKKRTGVRSCARVRARARLAPLGVGPAPF
jgi:hypothetical protein